MFRALIELILIFLFAIAARAILTRVLGGIANASYGAFRNRTPGPPANGEPASPQSETAGELHKDPVCGTYVAESTPFRRQNGKQTFYYCSDTCREKHALVAR